MSPEQRELCRLLSPLHEQFCEKHGRAEGMPEDTASPARTTSPATDFSLAKFRSALDELWEAAKELDRSMKRRDGSRSDDLRKCESGTLSLGRLDAPELGETRRHKQA
jgi:hypothetical protein